MLPLAVARIVVGKLFEEFHVRGQSDTDMRSFDEIVTEQPLLGETPRQYFVKGPNVVDAFAVIDRFAEDILIDVGNRLAIGIAPACVREQPRKTRCGCRWERDTDTRLNDRVAADAVALILREFHPVQRVRNRFDQSSRAAVWKLSVGIERDHITNARRRRSRVHKRPAVFAIQKTVEFLQLPAFALPSDPAALGLAPHPRSVKEDEGAIAMTRVELFDAFYRQPKQIVVFRHLRFFRVGEVRQQRKIEIRRGIGQVTHFQFLDLAANRVWRQEHHRNDDKSAAVFRYALLERHFRQRARRDKPRQPHLDQSKAQVRWPGKARVFPEAGALDGELTPSAVRRKQEGTHNSCCECGETPEIQQGRMPIQESQPPFAPRKTPPHAPFKLRQSFIQQVEGDASFTTTVLRALCANSTARRATSHSEVFDWRAVSSTMRRHRSRVAKSLWA